MKKILLVLAAYLYLTMQTGLLAQNVFVIDKGRLEEIKTKITEKDKPTTQLFEKLLKQADKFLGMKPVSVMDKEFTPVSGNKHDYMSQAPYFWYDSTKPNGLPYLRRDGVRNPEIYKITDRTFLGNLENASLVLSLAWHLTKNEKYAAKAAGLLKHWFINDATKMNPNLDYAQAIPGINNGRGIGIIESRTLIFIADAAGLLEGSASWPANDNKLLQQWYTAFLNWMLTSKNGNEEHAAKNNHGTWFYAQVIDFALFTGNNDKAKQLAEESKKRLDSQLTVLGQQPLELARTNALSYSTMNLKGWFTIAALAKKTGIDVWNYQTPEAVGLRSALDWLLPYALGEMKWEYQQITKYNKTETYMLLLQATTAFNNKKYLDAAKDMEKEEKDIITDLLYCK